MDYSGLFKRFLLFQVVIFSNWEHLRSLVGMGPAQLTGFKRDYHHLVQDIINFQHEFVLKTLKPNLLSISEHVSVALPGLLLASSALYVFYRLRAFGLIAALCFSIMSLIRLNPSLPENKIHGFNGITYELLLAVGVALAIVVDVFAVIPVKTVIEHKKTVRVESTEDKLTITDFEVTVVNNEPAIFFKIDLTSAMTRREWRVVRSNSHLKKLSQSLEESFLSLPQFPHFPLYLNFRSEREIKSQIGDLQDYLMELICRADTVNSVYLSNFLELENHLTEYMMFQPVLVNEVCEDSFMFADIHFSPKESLLLAGLCKGPEQPSLSSYFSSLWRDSSPKGRLNIYHIFKSNYGELHLKKVFTEETQSAVSVLNFIEDVHLLSLGHFDGSILVYKIFPSKIDRPRALTDKIASIKAHKNKVLNLGVDENTGYIYSAALGERNITICEMNYQTVIKVISLSTNPITNFSFEKESNRIYVTDNNDSIWVMQVENNVNLRILQAFHSSHSGLSCLKIEHDRSFIFVGTKWGAITFYDFFEKERHNLKINKRVELRVDPRGKCKLTDIKFKPSKSELLVAQSNGSVSFYSHNEELPEFVLDCHEKEVTRIFYDDLLKILVTCSADRSVKLYHLPQYWPSELMRENQLFNERNLIEDHTINENNMKKISNAFRNINLGVEENESPFEERQSSTMNECSVSQSVDTCSSQKISNIYYNETDMEVEGEDAGLIDKNYLYSFDENEEDALLDGWEYDMSMNDLANKKSYMNEIYSDFMTI